MRGTLRPRDHEAAVGVDMNDAALACALIDTQVRRRHRSSSSRTRRTAERSRTRASRDDLVDLRAVDSYPVVPIFQDRQITKLGPDRER